MQLNLKRIDLKNGVYYKILSYKKCCKKFCSDKNIVLRDNWQDGSYKPVISIEWKEKYWSYEDEMYNTIDKDIKFCPYCGKKIELNVVEKEDCELKYQELEKESNKLLDIANHTDSKTKEREFRNKANNVIGKQIEYLLTNDELPAWAKEDDL